MENANEVILVAQDGWLRYVNSRAEDLFRLDQRQLLSAPFLERVHPDDRPLVMERHRARLRGEGYPRPYAFRVLDGRNEVRWVELSGVTMEWEGRPASLNFLSDITERNQPRMPCVRVRSATASSSRTRVRIAVADPSDRFHFREPGPQKRSLASGVEPRG